jgi:hypothetical protein
LHDHRDHQYLRQRAGTLLTRAAVDCVTMHPLLAGWESRSFDASAALSTFLRSGDLDEELVSTVWPFATETGLLAGSVLDGDDVRRLLAAVERP